MAPDEVAYGIGQALFATRFSDAQSATPTRAAVWLIFSTTNCQGIA